MMSKKMLLVWNEAYGKALLARGGNGYFGHNLTPGDWGACAREGDQAVSKAMEIENAKRAAKNDNK